MIIYLKTVEKIVLNKKDVILLKEYRKNVRADLSGDYFNLQSLGLVKANSWGLRSWCFDLTEKGRRILREIKLQERKGNYKFFICGF